MANRYWIGGGSNNWFSTSSWSTSSGGSTGASIPTSADDVILDSSSLSTRLNLITGSGNAICKSITATATGFEIRADNLASDPKVDLYIYGTLDASAGGIYLNLGDQGFPGEGASIIFKGTTTGLKIDIGAGTTPQVVGFLTIDGVGGEYTLYQNWTFNSGTANTGDGVRLLNGTLNTNGKNITCEKFEVTGSGTKVLTLGASTITIQGKTFTPAAGAVHGDFSGSNLTINPGTSVININGVSGTVDTYFDGGSHTFYEVSSTLTGNINFRQVLTIKGANTYTNLKILPPVGLTKQFYVIYVTDNQTVTGTLTMTGQSAIKRVMFESINPPSNPCVLTAAAVSLTYVDFHNISGAGAAAPFTGTSLGNRANNSGITFTTPVTRYWVGNGGNWNSTTHWSASSGGASGASVPLPQDTVIFDANSITSASQTITFIGRTMGKDISFANVANNPTLTEDDSTAGESSADIFGDLILSAGMTFSFFGFNFWGDSTMDLTSNGVFATNDASISIISGGGSVVLQDELNMTLDSDIYLGGGTFEANNKNITTGYFYMDNYEIVVGYFPAGDSVLNMGSGTWTMIGTGGTEWSVIGDDITINAGTSHLIFQFPLGGGTDIDIEHNVASNTEYYDWSIIGSTGGNDTFTFDHGGGDDRGFDISFHDFTISGAPITVYTVGGHTYIMNIFTANGSFGNQIELPSIQDSETFAIFSAVMASVSYVTPYNNHAAGLGIDFDDSLGGIDGGGNEHWYFGGGSNTSLHTIQFVGINTAGDVQTMNVGKADDGTAINFELETQQLDFGNRSHLKQIADEIVVFTKDADASTLLVNTDLQGYKQIPISLENRVNFGDEINLEGHYMQFKWYGNTQTQTPIFEGFFINNITDKGMTDA